MAWKLFPKSLDELVPASSNTLGSAIVQTSDASNFGNWSSILRLFCGDTGHSDRRRRHRLLI